MKRNVLFLALALSAILAFSGCSKQTDASSAVPANTVPESQTASSQQGSSQVAQSSAASSQAVSSAVKGGTVSQNGSVKTIRTENAAFNKRFNDNPIDKKYIAEMKDAVSNVAMVNVSNKYAGIWQKEITNAYESLNKALWSNSSMQWVQIQTDQKAWENGKTAALNKIASDAQASGGSMAQVEEASQTMDFYRDRAATLYSQLYQHDKNYTYAFK